MTLVGEKRGFIEIYNLKEKRARRELIRCIFVGINYDVEIIEISAENGKTIYWSEMFRIELTDRSYIATLRKNLSIEVSENGTIFKFVQSQTTQNPPVVLGSGSFGIVFKIIGTDGKWYVVKSFETSSTASDEWIPLQKVAGQHLCIQHAYGCQINRDGDLKHIIVSHYQGDMTLSASNENRKGCRLVASLILLFLKLSYGLDEIHMKGLIHGDIKTNNIVLMINLDGTSKLVLIDFGLAKEIGSIIDNPNSFYTWCFRCPRMFLGESIKMYPYVKSILASRIMDWWAFFVTFLHSFSDRSIDFLGFRSKTEEQARRVMSENSCALWVMKTMNGLGYRITDISIIQQIYFVLLNKQGPDEFLKIFNSFGFTLDEGDKIYAEYVEQFHILRNKSPIIGHVKGIFNSSRLRGEKENTDISDVLSAMTNLFVEILRDGADLSLLDALTIKHIDSWFAKLEEILKMIDKIGQIYI